MFSHKDNVPLALRLAPQNFAQYEGQNHVVPTIQMMTEKNSVRSMIFYGPPASGKTGLARIIAQTIQAEFVVVNALTLSSDEIRSIHSQAENNARFNKKTILFIDEMHRLTKPKQDAFLASLESGLIILIGATTENPFFALQPALRSRLLIFEFFALELQNLQRILQRAFAEDEFINQLGATITEDGAKFLIEMSSDPRNMLTVLEATILAKGVGSYQITKQDIETIFQKSDTAYNSGDSHYDIISAFIKSIRGSDPDAALHYLAIMVHSGEDPRFIFRRLMISAVEDIGMAYPSAIDTVVSCADAFEKIGLPEGLLHLSHATIFLAGLPKSASVLNIYTAMEAIKQGNMGVVPPHLQDAHYAGAKTLGRGIGYKYPHDYEEHFVKQDYTSSPVSYYKPSEQGFEKRIKERLQKLWGDRY